MGKPDSIERFRILQERLADRGDRTIPVVVVPAGTCGRASGAEELVRVAEREISEKELSDKVRIRVTGCHGFCEMEPSVLVEPDRTFYPKIDAVGMAVSVVDQKMDRLLREMNSNKRKTGE